MLRKREDAFHKDGIWQYQEAKAKLSQVMDLVQQTGKQVIIRNRNQEYIILSKEKYDEVTKPQGTLLDFFLKAPCPEVDLDISRSDELSREADL